MPEHAAPEPYEKAPEADARNRALRTFLQGLAVDVLLAVCLVAYDALQSDAPDWRLLLLTLLKTALMTAASYVMRKLQPPATA